MKFEPIERIHKKYIPQFTLTPDIDAFVRVKYLGDFNRGKELTRCCYVHKGKRCEEPAYFKRDKTPFFYCVGCFGLCKVGEETKLVDSQYSLRMKSTNPLFSRKKGIAARVQPKFILSEKVKAFINVRTDNLQLGTRCCYINSHGIRCSNVGFLGRFTTPFLYCKPCDYFNNEGEEMLLLK